MVTGSDLEKLKLSAEQRKDVFLIFRELLNNIRKHARARRVEAAMQYEAPMLTMSVSDDGIGFDRGSNKERNGLELMRIRVAKWKGSMVIHTNENRGTRIDIRIPIRRVSPLKVIFSTKQGG